MTTFSQPLAQAALSSLQHTLKQYAHHPSDRMWDALRDLLDTLSAMAEGTAAPKVYLSSLDPGVGKTQAVVAFLRALVASQEHADSGALVCVSRLQEVEDLVETAGLPEGSFAVLTSDNRLNALGGNPEGSQVLFTTQQMLKTICGNGSLGRQQRFAFNGKPRPVRVWDETLVPAQPIALARDDVTALAGRYRRDRPQVAEALDGLADAMRSAGDRGIVSVPDLAGDHSLSRWAAMKAAGQHGEDIQETAEKLWTLSGQQVRIRVDGKLGPALVSYSDNLPEDLAPLLVLDASARVRQTYQLWERRRGGVQRLHSAVKDYSDLTVHLWHKGGGKRAFRDPSDRAVRVQGIAETIKLQPDEEWLVVAHKDPPGYDIAEELRGYLGTTLENVHFLTWGSHHASNAFSHVRHIVLAGTLFYRTSHYEALLRAAGGVGVEEDAHGHRQDEQEFLVSESSHMVLQALCRGAVRKAEGECCPPCHAYIIADQWSGLPNALPNIFPGCEVKPWRPLGVSLSGKPKAAAEYLREQTDRLHTGLIPFIEVASAVGLGSSNFRKNVRKYPDFIGFLEQEGIKETPRLVRQGQKPPTQTRYFTSRYYYWFGPDLPDDSDMPFDPRLEGE